MTTKTLLPSRFDFDGADVALLAAAAVAAIGLLVSLYSAGLLTFDFFEALLGGAIGMGLAVTLFNRASSLLKPPHKAEGDVELEAGSPQS